MGGRKRKRSSAPAPRTTRARRGGPSARGSCSPSSSTPFQREDGSGPSTSWTPAAPQQAASSRNPLPRQTGPSAHVPPVESRSPGPSPSGSSPSGSSLPPRPGAQPSRSHGPLPPTSLSRGHRDLPGEPQLTFPLWLHVWDEARFQELLGPLLPYLHHMEEEVWVYVSGSDSMLVTPPWASDPTIRQVEETLAPSSSFSRSLFSSELCYSASNR